MSEYIIDDRMDYIELMKKIDSMTDKEFEAYCEELKSNENK
jgi:hypothetical protein